MVCIGHHYQSVVNATLHVIGTASHQQIGTLGPTLQRYLYSIRVIVPQRSEDYILPLSRALERNACHHELPVLDEGTENGVVDLGSHLRMTPLPYSLYWYLECRRLWTRTQILVPEDISDIGIEVPGYILRTERFGKVWLRESIRIVGTDLDHLMLIGSALYFTVVAMAKMLTEDDFQRLTEMLRNLIDLF